MDAFLISWMAILSIYHYHYFTQIMQNYIITHWWMEGPNNSRIILLKLHLSHCVDISLIVSLNVVPPTLKKKRFWP